MKKKLEKQIRQIAETINNLEDGEMDDQSLLELDELFDLLNKKIKSTKLGNPLINQTRSLESMKYEAIIIFDQAFKVYKYTGTIDQLTYANKDSSVTVQDLLKLEDFDLFRKQVSNLLKSHQHRVFEIDVHSIQGVPLSASISLEVLSSEKGKELILCGINFSNTTLADIQSYQQIVIENLPDIDVFLFDTEHRYVLAGGREKERFGLSNSYFAGKTLFEAYDEKISKRMFPFYRKALSGEMADGEIRIENQIYYIWATPVRNFYDEVVGGTAIMQNVTRDKEVEAHLKKAKDDAQKADQAKSIFLANMSHEIRTPLNAIIGFTEQLNKASFASQQQKFVDLIGESSEHLLYLVNEILILFKLGMGKVHIDRTPFSLNHVLNVIYDSFIIKANEKKLNLYVQIDSKVPDALVGDSFRLKQVLINLLSNAIRYTDEGSVDLRCMLIDENSKRVRVKFAVEDTGPGISDDILPTIFEEFTQSKTRIDKHRKGAGLGLAITKKLVELLDGTIAVACEQGKGSLFTVELTFKKAKRQDVVKKEAFYSMRENLMKEKHILFADDDQHNLFLAETILKNWGANYKLAIDGEDALKKITNEPFDIVLLDIHMPKMSGMDVIKKVRANSKNPNAQTKMLAVTANVLKSDIRTYIDSGFNDYLLKPFKEDELYNKICNVLQISDSYSNASADVQTNPDAVKDISRNSDSGFCTDNLKITASGDVEFFNKMINTFIKNTLDAREKIDVALKNRDWEEIGEKAHRAIPSFKYFGLDESVILLSELENLALRDKKYSEIPEKSEELLNQIETIIEQAKKSIITN